VYPDEGHSIHPELRAYVCSCIPREITTKAPGEEMVHIRREREREREKGEEEEWLANSNAAYIGLSSRKPAGRYHRESLNWEITSPFQTHACTRSMACCAIFSFGCRVHLQYAFNPSNHVIADVLGRTSQFLALDLKPRWFYRLKSAKFLISD
jgi:hypothetical protein